MLQDIGQEKSEEMLGGSKTPMSFSMAQKVMDMTGQKRIIMPKRKRFNEDTREETMSIRSGLSRTHMRNLSKLENMKGRNDSNG